MTIKDGFEVVLNKTDTELIIEAEDQDNGNTFSAKFENDEIKSMSLDLYENVPELFEVLVTAFEGISEDTIINVDHKGKLLFIQKLKMGKPGKVFNFPIPLKLVEVDAMKRLEKQVRRLFREIEGLKKENHQLKEKLNLDYNILSPSFKVSDTKSGYISISEDKKQITRNVNNNGFHFAFSSEVPLSKEQNSKFQVKIDNLYGTIAIGMATKDAMRNQDCLSCAGSYCLMTPNYIYENGAHKNYMSYSNLSTGSIVGVLFIPSKSEIVFDINETHVYTMKINQEADLYPFGSLINNSSKVPFV